MDSRQPSFLEVETHMTMALRGKLAAKKVEFIQKMINLTLNDTARFLLYTLDNNPQMQDFSPEDSLSVIAYFNTEVYCVSEINFDMYRMYPDQIVDIDLENRYIVISSLSEIEHLVA